MARTPSLFPLDWALSFAALGTLAVTWSLADKVFELFAIPIQ